MKTSLKILIVAGFVAVLALPAHAYPTYNGVGSYMPANGYDAPIFRQFAFVEGTITQYHVLTPETFRVDQHKSRIYQFPECATLQPVLQHHWHVDGDGGYWAEHDAPTRQIVDVVLATGCARQPTSENETLALALAVNPRPLYVNAPAIPQQLENMTDAQLFNDQAPRPRIHAWMEGHPVKFITYETSWSPEWVGNAFPNEADVYMVSYGATFRPGITIFNAAAGSPLTASARSYSPIWRAHCVEDAVNQKCMVSVTQQTPGYRQCNSAADCLSLVNTVTGLQVIDAAPNTFTHIDCPMVAVDLNHDNYIDSWEELQFPDLWTHGPVLV